jgi:acetylglutamate kinase
MGSVARPILVAKLGGGIAGSAEHVAAFWRDAATLIDRYDLVVVHGGGPQATALARQLGHEPRIVKGRRVTTELDLKIALWTMRGELNGNLVAAARAFGIPAVGVSAIDGTIVDVQRRPPRMIDGVEVDFGYVGDVASVRPDLIHVLLKNGFTPVLSPLCTDATGQIYNVNADTIACGIAGALGAARFLLITESGGVLDRNGGLLQEIDRARFEQGAAEGWIAGGMLVKLELAFQALDEGIKEVLIASPDDIIERRKATLVMP